jgi:aspartate kinase
MIVAENKNDFDPEKIITGIAGRKGFSVITIEKDMMNSEVGYGRKVLEVLEDNEISFEHLPSGIDNMSVVIESAVLDGRRDKVLASINRAVRADSIAIEDGLALVAIVGLGMVKYKGAAARVFNAISAAGINIRMIDQGSSELSIIVGVEEHDFEKAVCAIYNEFVK